MLIFWENNSENVSKPVKLVTEKKELSPIAITALQTNIPGGTKVKREQIVITLGMSNKFFDMVDSHIPTEINTAFW